MIISREINNLYKRYGEKKLAHAFLLETNDMDKCLKDILVLVKMLNCQNKYTSNCSEECNICRLIDNGSLPSLIVVNPDGASIKKNQVLELQEESARFPNRKHLDGTYSRGFAFDFVAEHKPAKVNSVNETIS